MFCRITALRHRSADGFLWSQIFRYLLILPLLGTLALAPGTSAMANGVNFWQQVYGTVPMRDLAASPVGYVAAGANGLWFSTNLTNWQEDNAPAGSGLPYATVIWGGGQFLAGVNGIVASPDGVNWTLVYSDPVNQPYFSSIVYANGVYLAAGEDLNGAVILRSTDGHTWTPEATGLNNSGNFIYALCEINYGNGLYVATGQKLTSTTAQDVILTSPDGINWTQQSLPNNGNDAIIESAGVSSGAYGNGLFVEGGIGGIYTSADGVNWTEQFFPWLIFHIAFENGEFVGAGLDFQNSPLQYAAAFTSPDGINWSARDIALRQSSALDLSSIRYFNGEFILSGYTGVWTSLDSTNWSQVFAGPESSGFACLGYGGGHFLLLPPLENPDSLVFVSSDGVNWPDILTDTGAPIGGGSGPGCVAYGDGKFIAGGLNEQPVPYYSSGGTLWTTASAPASASFGPVVWNGAGFLSLGGYNDGSGMVAAAYASADGTSWAPAAVSGLPATDLSGYQMKYVGGTYFAWSGRALYRSTDGVNWTASSVPSAFTRIDDIAYGAGRFVLSGGNPSFDLYGLLVAQSVDGMNWQQESGLPPTVSEPNGAPAQMIYAGDEFVILCMDNAADLSAYLTSHDGLSWTETIQPGNWTFQQVAWDGTKLVASSYFGIYAAYGVTQDIAGTASAGHGKGRSIKYHFTVSNDSPDGTGATGVELADALPAGATLSKVSSSQGSCSGDNSQVTCALGALDAGSAATVDLNIKVPSGPCTISDTANTYADQPLTDASNSSVTVTVNRSHC